MSEIILSAKKLKKDYLIRSGFGKTNTIKAVNNVSFELRKGQTLGIVGESGCGKSTMAKVLMGLEPATGGDYFFKGKNVKDLNHRDYFKKVQMVFQDPYSSLNPRKPVWFSIAEPLMINDNIGPQKAKKKAMDLMELVGLRGSLADRYPHMFSGGQRQRIGIARALILDPEVIICDEPVSALDISVQAQVLNLLIKLQKEFSLSYLFISHDLSVVQYFSDDIGVMYFGHMVEYGPSEKVFHQPIHPYTKGLIESAPMNLSKDFISSIEGELPSPITVPRGCPLYTRCNFRSDKCSEALPEVENKDGRSYLCFNPVT